MAVSLIVPPAPAGVSGEPVEYGSCTDQVNAMPGYTGYHPDE
ncbi:hypothetical protein [Pigmentiphaga sp. NML080357]|nr:hypothetical protein [Pigmentiphaga sp. NML080357]